MDQTPSWTGADWVLERSACNGKEPQGRPGESAVRATGVEEYATGRFTKEPLLNQARAWGLTNRRGRPLTSQAIGMLLRNQLYAGIVDVPEYGVRGKRGDFESLISQDPVRPGGGRAGRPRAHELRASADRQRRWRLAKAQPDPHFRYRSNATARLSSANSTTRSMRHGRPFALWRQRPALWASSRSRQSL